MIVTVTGWTLPQLGATPWPDVLDLLDYWAENPPVHLMVKAYLGIESKDSEDYVEMDQQQLERWLGSVQG